MLHVQCTQYIFSKHIIKYDPKTRNFSFEMILSVEKQIFERMICIKILVSRNIALNDKLTD